MENTRGAIVRWGLLFGGIMALLGSADAIVTILLEGSLAGDLSTVRAFTTVTLASSLVSCGLNVVYLALFFVAGILTARRTGKVGAGALAGLLAGGLGKLITGTVTVTLLFLSRALFPTSRAGGIPIVPAAGTAQIVITAIGGLVIWCGLGAGLGALGALVGQSQFRTAHPELAQPRPYASAPYPPGPYPGYPPVPPMGAYPPPPSGAYPPPPGTYPPPSSFSPSQPGQ
jgi:hypothetical protein